MHHFIFLFLVEKCLKLCIVLDVLTDALVVIVLGIIIIIYYQRQPLVIRDQIKCIDRDVYQSVELLSHEPLQILKMHHSTFLFLVVLVLEIILNFTK